MRLHWQTGDAEAGQVWRSYRDRHANWYIVLLVSLVLGLIALAVSEDDYGDTRTWVWQTYIALLVGLVVGTLMLISRAKRRFNSYVEQKRIIHTSPLVANFAAAVEALVQAEASAKYAWLTRRVLELMELEGGAVGQDVQTQVATIIEGLMRELDAPRTAADAAVTSAEH